MSYPDNATASLAQFLFRDSQGAMYIIPRRAFHNGSQYGDTVTIVQDLSGNGNDLTGTAVFDRRSFFGVNISLDNVRDAQFIRDVNMSAPVSGMGTTIRAVPGGTVTFDEGALDGTITDEFSVLILIDRTLSEREKHVVSELARLWGGANWTPGSLFTDGKDGIWLDPSDHSTLWIDEDRTQNATQPGDVVWHIDDKSGNGNHFSVESSADRARLVRWPASAVQEGGPRNLGLRTELPLSGGAGWAGTTENIQVNGQSYARRAATPGAGGNVSYRNAPMADGTYTFRFRWLPTNEEQYLYISRSSNSMQPRSPVVSSAGIVSGNLLAGVSATLNDDGSIDIVIPTIITGGSGGRNYRWEITVSGEIAEHSDWLFTRAEYQAGSELVGNYQRVGAGIWDVTEEGQPDCWGILANGVNTRYISERVIPEYEDGKLRMLVGQTKQRSDSVANGSLIASNTNGSANNSFSLYAHLVDNRSYLARYRSTSSIDVVTSDSAYPSPHTGILDHYVDSGGVIVRFRVNDDPATTRTRTGCSGTIDSSNPITLFSLGAGQYEGILWSLILTAYAPDETLWNRVARDWLNSANMPGVLDDD